MNASSESTARPREPTVFTRIGPRENSITRVFHARRERVFQLATDPVAVRSLWAPNPENVTVESWDCRSGGSYVLTVQMPDGEVARFSGEFREVTAPSKLVNTLTRSKYPGRVTVETDRLEALGPSSTRFTATWVHETAEEIDRMAGPEMERVVSGMWDRFAELVERP
jgi:uncharacterized protein YndB with AHSA1/START domain